MNAYRVALILCRAIAFSLWWSALIVPTSAAIAWAIVHSGVTGTEYVGASNNNFLWSWNHFVFLSVAALLLQIFGRFLCASITDNRPIDNEITPMSDSLNGDERAIAGAGAGLILLFYGLASVSSSAIWIIYSYFGNAFATAAGRDAMIWSIASGVTPSILRCVIGFVLAFQLGLRRVMKPQDK